MAGSLDYLPPCIQRQDNRLSSPIRVDLRDIDAEGFPGFWRLYFACRTMARPLTASEPASMAVAVRRGEPAPKVSKLTWSVEVCVSPGADNSARPMSLASGGKQVIGALERDEASRVAGQAEDLARVLDAYRGVSRRVQD